jgi:PIN domain nuclease of toxin-antitoxin system
LADIYVIDTHALLWYLGEHPRLSPRVKQILDNRRSRFALPAIAYAEALSIVERGRAPLQISEEELVASVKNDTRIVIFPLDQATVEMTLACKAVNEMHDRQIVATAVLLQQANIDVAILTRDENIQQANLVPAIW